MNSNALLPSARYCQMQYVYTFLDSNRCETVKECAERREKLALDRILDRVFTTEILMLMFSITRE